MSERRKKILIATPIHNDNLLLSYVQSVCSLINNKDKPYDVTVFFRKGSLVNRCRNELLAYFMQTDCDYIFFIDSDIVHFEEAFYKIVDSYLELEKRIPKLMLGAIYPIKHYNVDYMGRFKIQENWQEGLLNYNVNIKNLNIDNNAVLMEADQNNGFVHCQDIAGGFMMFSKKVLLDMIAFYPESKYSAFNNDIHLPREHLYNLFHSFVEETTRFYLSEDYGFCYYFRKMGGVIYADIKLRLSHFGEEKFTGALYNTLLVNAPQQQAQQQVPQQIQQQQIQQQQAQQQVPQQIQQQQAQQQQAQQNVKEDT
jgi:hypothetical protein